jgi:hypothetical protein
VEFSGFARFAEHSFAVEKDGFDFVSLMVLIGIEAPHDDATQGARIRNIRESRDSDTLT